MGGPNSAEVALESFNEPASTELGPPKIPPGSDRPARGLTRPIPAGVHSKSVAQPSAFASSKNGRILAAATAAS